MELICVSDVYRVVIPFTETLRFSVYILCCVKNMYYLIPCISYIFELACSSLKLYEMGKYAKKKKKNFKNMFKFMFMFSWILRKSFIFHHLLIIAFM